jgi:hypothetical protein
MIEAFPKLRCELRGARALRVWPEGLRHLFARLGTQANAFQDAEGQRRGAQDWDVVGAVLASAFLPDAGATWRQPAPLPGFGCAVERTLSEPDLGERLRSGPTAHLERRCGKPTLWLRFYTKAE